MFILLFKREWYILLVLESENLYMSAFLIRAVYLLNLRGQQNTLSLKIRLVLFKTEDAKSHIFSLSQYKINATWFA